MMEETEFWELIDSARTAADGDADEQGELLVDRLAQLDPDAVTCFAQHFESRYNRAYQWDLWAAAWILLDGASDDVFSSFRCWLIGQGREVFENAAHDADTLAGLLGEFDADLDGDGEELGFTADDAYEQLTGQELPELGLPEPPEEPVGVPLDLEDERALAERLPKLWERFRA
ncbi:DUF4240 domain-containing protein [Streptomyces sp. HNM0574]|uniref:DUF4240 domain-containing protein n=1 Tax=Streptomyces sp. HNM0574 TaxID=2714954 RepID=UPI00146EAAA8|nr:DUF4240 domain-containing protein [Streptomyces sp. HNM0574]NLU67729.1 DUF4240 domain-containing protein [Streptomyces sp. HNM0574]